MLTRRAFIFAAPVVILTPGLLMSVKPIYTGWVAIMDDHLNPLRGYPIWPFSFIYQRRPYIVPILPGGN